METTLFGNLKGIFWLHWREFAKGFLMVALSNFLLIFNPLILRQAILYLNPSVGQSTGYLQFISSILGPHIFAWGSLLVVVAFLSAYFKYHMRLRFVAVSRVAEKEMRSKLFDRIESQSSAFFDKHGVGEILSRMTNDISAYREVLGPGIIQPSMMITLSLPALVALFTIAPPLATLSVIPIILIPLLFIALRGSMYKSSSEVQKSLGEMSTIAQEDFSGIRIIKSYGIEEATQNKFKKVCKEFSLASFKMSCLQGIFYPLFAFTTKIVTTLLVLLTGLIVILGWQTLNAADFVSFMWIQSYLFMPLLALGWILPVWERGRAAYDRLRKIYNEPIEVKEQPDALKDIPKQSDIKFTNLSFTYPNQTQPALSNVDLNIQHGSFIGFTGPVGSGKSTLFKLLNREYEIPEGMITIGDQDIHCYSLDAFRQDLVSVEQAPFLFSKTIADNVRFGKTQASQEEIEWVARQADLHETVLDFPEEYETMVGERGVTLSGGQKQRVAMARAFLVDRSILLLDDIFSAVDSATEKKIFGAILENFKGKTMLLITHRVSILEQMERVIYLKNGKIVEDGSPEKLKAAKGQYAALYELQSQIKSLENSEGMI